MITAVIRLRSTHAADLPWIVAVEQHADNRAFVGQWTHEQHHAALQNDDIAHLVIECREDGQPVGYVIIVDVANPDQCLQLRRSVIADKGQGYGRAALRAVQQWAFMHQGAHRLWLDVKTHNTRVRALYESEGFVAEGVLRACLKTDTGYESLAT